MFTVEDIDTIESDEQASELEYYTSIQRAINSGMWSLQGSYGREMMEAIKAGLCMLGENRAQDYWGNTIPSRHDVLPCSAGSAEFVEDRQGLEWRLAMESA